MIISQATAFEKTVISNERDIYAVNQSDLILIDSSEKFERFFLSPKRQVFFESRLN